MLVRNVDQGDLDNALASVNEVFSGNVRFRRCDREGNSRGGGSTYRVTLTVNDSSAPGSRRSVGYNAGRRIAAACWHVYGMYFDSLPDQAVIVVSGQSPSKPGDPWVDRNIGSMMYPVRYSEACLCEDDPGLWSTTLFTESRPYVWRG
jgi:hypothetical protein